MHFEKLRLIQPLLRAVLEEGYTTPTPIQQQAIPTILEGRDIFGCAQTGTGKTAAFSLPILQKLFPHAKETPQKNSHGKSSQFRRPIRALILTPTRELAAQIGESLDAYGRYTNVRHTVIFGGVSQYKQVQSLKKGVDILVATPGRLFDLMDQRHVDISHVEIFVLDEADRMLDMGFIHDIRRIVEKLPQQRQNLMFSATLPQSIRALAESILKDPVTVQAPQESPAADTVRQSLYYVEQHHKPFVLEHLLQHEQVTRAIVFTRTKRRADRVAKQLYRSEIAAEAIHSDKSQNARLRALKNFKTGGTRVLVASDIASRGIDVDSISHVFNYDLPNEPETYVHRIGRTGRAGESGHAISFCCGDQKTELKDIEKLLGRAIPVQKHSLNLPLVVEGNAVDAAPTHEPRSRRTHEKHGENSGRKNERHAAQKEQRAEHKRGERKNEHNDEQKSGRHDDKRRDEGPRKAEHKDGQKGGSRDGRRQHDGERRNERNGRKGEHRQENRPFAGGAHKKAGRKPQHGKPRSTRGR